MISIKSIIISDNKRKMIRSPKYDNLSLLALQNHKKNLHLVQSFIKQKMYEELLSFYNFDLKELIKKNLLIPILENSNMQVIMHLVTNLLDYSITDYTGQTIVHYLMMYVENSEMIKNFIVKYSKLLCPKYIFQQLVTFTSMYNQMLLIHYACKYCHINVIEYLISCGVNLEQQTLDKYRPIHLAIDNNNLTVVKLLLMHNVNVECKTILKWRPIHFATNNDNLEIVNLLIDLKVNLDCKTVDKYMPIHFACKNKNTKMVKLLIEKNVDLNCKTKNNYQPIHFACKYLFDDFFELMSGIDLEYNAKTNNGWRPIHYACSAGSLCATKFLISQGAILNVFTDDGLTPYMCAKKYDHTEIMMFLELCNTFDNNDDNLLELQPQSLLQPQCLIQSKCLIQPQSLLPNQSSVSSVSSVSSLKISESFRSKKIKNY